jgi:hypothetical protein
MCAGGMGLYRRFFQAANSPLVTIINGKRGRARQRTIDRFIAHLAQLRTFISV